MQTSRLLLLLAGVPLLVPMASGCTLLLNAPPVDPTPTPVSTPKAPFFDPAAGQSRGPGISTPLNKAGDPVLADAFRIAGITSGDRITIQSVKTMQSGGKPTLTLGVPDPVRLAGIVAPTTDPGLSLARKAISDWTAGRDVDIEQDGKYPTDLKGVRVVHIFYKGRETGAGGKPSPYAGTVLSLNRMLVRSGNAVVDLYSPTAFDTSQWLLDEQYAKRHRLGFWKFGVALQQRLPIDLATGKSTGTGARSKVSIVPTSRSGRANPGSATGGAMSGAAMPGAASSGVQTTTPPAASTAPAAGAAPAGVAPAGAAPAGAAPAAPVNP